MKLALGGFIFDVGYANKELLYMSDFNDVLDRIYYKEKNYDSIKELYRKAKLRDKNITLEDVKQWLQKQATHQLTTKPKIGKKEYKQIYDEK